VPQVFHRSSNTVARVSIIGVLLLLIAVLLFLYLYVRSNFFTRQGVPITQPVPFSHEHHVGGLGIDCRYCHTSVEYSSFAGMPPTQTCMNCHSQIWTQADILQPIRDSFQTGQPVQWTRVYNLPNFVYFNHAAHVQKGVACETCHGRVDQMPLMTQAVSLHMDWCVSCHRDPARFIRPQDQVFTMGWQPPVDQSVLGPELVKQNHVQSLTSCSTCHR
jgi:hypothetical protein